MTSGSLSYLHFKLTESKLALWEVIITVITQNIRLSFLKTGGEKKNRTFDNHQRPAQRGSCTRNE